jgi:ClpP class serine protease
MNWLIREDIARAMARDRKAGTGPSVALCMEFDAKWRAEEDARVERLRTADSGSRPVLAAGDLPRNMKVAGDTAEIAIEGALTRRLNYYAYYYGGGNTAYQDIINALAIAQSDPTIKRVLLRMNSCGGNVDGLFETLAALESFSKPIETVASEACSAAYAIAALTNRITGATPAAIFGSIGVACTYIFFDDVEEIAITSTEAPDKRPDVRTEEGKAVVRRELDAIHDLFVDAIARGRKTTVKNVNANFGRGACVLCMEAMRLGMCDGSVKPVLRVAADTASDCCDCDPCGPECPCDPCAPGCACHQNTNHASASAAAQTARKHMDLKTLKAQHPDVFEAAAQEGEARERDRAQAHLTMGSASGDMQTALAAVASGEAMTQALQAKYMAAGMNRADRAARQTESDAATAATAGAAPKTGEGEAAVEGDLGDQIVAFRKAQKGTL